VATDGTDTYHAGHDEKEVASQVTAPMQPVAKRTARHLSSLAMPQRLAAAAIALLALVILISLFLPRVTVVVAPVSRTLERPLTIPLSSETNGYGGVALRSLEISVEASASAPATGRRQQGVAAATGTVILFNETEREIAVAAGTIVATDGGQRFTVANAVRVPARRAEYFMEVPVGIKAGQTEARVRAQELGNSGNVAAGRITSLPQGPAGLRVVNPEAMRGGAERTIAYATHDDLAGLRQRLGSELRLKAQPLLSSDAGEGAYLIHSLVEVQETEFAARPAVGAATDAVHATLRGRARGRYVLVEDVRRYVRKEADAFVPKGYVVLGSPVVSIEGEPEKGGVQELQVSSRISVGGTVDPVAISRLVAGRTPEQARRLLLETGEVGDMDVQGRLRKHLPTWTPWIRVVVAGTSDNEVEVIAP
jgi:hypothetical protein